MAITATMAEAQNDYYKAMRAGKREGEILPNLDDILKEIYHIYPRLSRLLCPIFCISR